MRVVALIFLTALAGPAIALISAPAPREPGLRLVLHAPWADVAALRSVTGVRPVGPLNTPVAFFVTSAGQQADQALREAGAWSILDGERLAEICGAEL